MNKGLFKVNKEWLEDQGLFTEKKERFDDKGVFKEKKEWFDDNKDWMFEEKKEGKFEWGNLLKPQEN